MAGYSKLHSSLVNSSLWTESDSVRILFITLLAMSDRDGCVYGSRLGLSRIAQVDPDSADEAFNTLMAPDDDSCDKLRAPENKGRRIEEIPGGFRLLNYEYYRGLRNEDDRREQNRLAQDKLRQKHRVSRSKPASAGVSRSKPASATVGHCRPLSSHAEADAEAVPPLPPKGGDGIRRRDRRKMADQRSRAITLLRSMGSAPNGLPLDVLQAWERAGSFDGLPEPMQESAIKETIHRRISD